MAYAQISIKQAQKNSLDLIKTVIDRHKRGKPITYTKLFEMLWDQGIEKALNKFGIKDIIKFMCPKCDYEFYDDKTKNSYFCPNCNWEFKK